MLEFIKKILVFLFGSKEDSAGQLAIIQGIIEMISKGGIDGFKQLLEKFKSLGLGEIIASWIGTGANLPISIDQVKQVFGEEKIRELANKFKLTVTEMAGKIAQYLPMIIDKITPNGQLPTGNLAETIKKFLTNQVLQVILGGGSSSPSQAPSPGSH